SSVSLLGEPNSTRNGPPLPCRWLATRTFSRTVRSEKTRVCWKVRTNPRRASACGGRPVTSSPRNLTRPADGLRNPVTTLKVVVFPAPFGPTSPRTSPCFTWNESSETAAYPPKCRLRCSTLSSSSLTVESWSLTTHPAHPGRHPRLEPPAA